MRACIALGLLLLCTRIAVAQPGATPPGPYPPGPPPPYYSGYGPPPPPPPSGPPLSESTALWLSLGGTIASYGLVAIAGSLESQNGGSNDSAAGTLGGIGSLGIFLAPSFGHWYADKYWTRGLALRLGALGVIVGGAILALMASPCPLFGGGHGDDEPCDESTSGVIMITAVIGSGVMFVGGTVDDIVQAPRRVRRHNAALQGGMLTLAPMRTQDGGGLALVGRW